MSQSGVDVRINFANELQQASAALQSTPQQLQLAGQRAIRKTMRWLQTRIARELSQTLGFAQKTLKPRLVMKTVGKGAEQVTILWLGTAPLLAENVGRPRQTKAGVSVGKRRYEGAFVADMYGYDNAVWIRASRNNGQYDTTSKQRRPNTNSISASMRGRFPVQHIAVDIEDHAAEVFKRFQARIPDEFRKILQQELNYAVNHER